MLEFLSREIEREYFFQLCESVRVRFISSVDAFRRPSMQSVEACSEEILVLVFSCLSTTTINFCANLPHKTFSACHFIFTHGIVSHMGFFVCNQFKKHLFILFISCHSHCDFGSVVLSIVPVVTNPQQGDPVAKTTPEKRGKIIQMPKLIIKVLSCSCSVGRVVKICPSSGFAVSFGNCNSLFWNNKELCSRCEQQQENISSLTFI